MKRIALLIGVLCLYSTVALAAGTPVSVELFYSPTCQHCMAEQAFLDTLEQEYGDAVQVDRYSITDEASVSLLSTRLATHNAEEYFGLVPMTFVGEDTWFPGFDNSSGIGMRIRAAIETELGHQAEVINPDAITIPLLGTITPGDVSLPALAVILGFLDGFNVCSLGALLLILGLVLALRSRGKILFFGGLFIITTAVVYGFLIVLWHQVFQFLAPYTQLFSFIVGALGVGGGIFFLREFAKFRKYGPTCETTGSGVVKHFTGRLKHMLAHPGRVLSLAGVILLFAAVITIVEFPCSAAVPVVFAGVLAEAQVGGLGSVLYIALFVLFYMLDELVVFAIAVWQMKLWMSSPKVVTWATLVEGIVLIGLGLFYLMGVI